ncbi:THAP domain-containing protein 1-like [Engraulis encrasicolus]|uniref:THAP domain-containing protein 1-like n=1 Tax=Engraulis encrasicolus TaxID=184585 RepID=UPI002FD1F095
MPYCCAYACSVRPGQGKKLHRFPRDLKRRKLWESKVRRKNWSATDCSVLCEDHFDEKQYESGRADGLRKLRPNAVPTEFTFTRRKCPWRPIKCRTEDELCPGAQEQIGLPVGLQIGLPVHVDHSYCSTESHNSTSVQTDIQVDRDQFNLMDNACTNKAVSGETASSETASRERASSETANRETVSRETAGRENVSKEMTNLDKQLNTLKNQVSSLQRALIKERKEKLKAIKQRKQLEANISGVFNTNQLYKLSQASTRGTKWSAETIKKGLQLYLACGATGYDLLIAQNQPLPSARSLRRRLEVRSQL